MGEASLRFLSKIFILTQLLDSLKLLSKIVKLSEQICLSLRVVVLDSLSYSSLGTGWFTVACYLSRSYVVVLSGWGVGRSVWLDGHGVLGSPFT